MILQVTEGVGILTELAKHGPLISVLVVMILASWTIIGVLWSRYIAEKESHRETIKLHSAEWKEHIDKMHKADMESLQVFQSMSSVMTENIKTSALQTDKICSAISGTERTVLREVDDLKEKISK